MAGELQPILLTIGAGIATTLLGAIGKLWSENKELRRELATANEQIVFSQLEAEKRSNQHQRDHRRDLQRLAGLPSSSSSTLLAVTEPYTPPVIIRPKVPRIRKPPKKPGEE